MGPGSPPQAKIDEASGGLVERLTEALGKLSEVQFAYLFGSWAKGRPHPGSDVDVAVHLTPEAQAGPRLELLRSLSRACETAVGDRLDLVVLNEAGCLLSHRVLRDGRLLVCRVPEAHVGFMTRAVAEYLDTGPLREVHIKATRQRLAERSGHG